MPLHLFTYIGGKFYLARHVITLLPSHTCYVEVFGGAANVLLQKKPSKVEVLNDYDNDIYVVWKTMKERAEEVQEYLDNIVFHESFYNEIVEQWQRGYKGKDDVERTAWFLFMQHASFSGLRDGSFRYSTNRNHVNAFFTKLQTFKLIQERLKRVLIFNRDFRDILDMYDSEEVVFYLDPPYYGTEDYYNVKFTLQDHIDLAMLLNRTKAKFILSYYDYPFLQKLYPPDRFYYYHIHVVKRTAYAKGEQKPTATEILITNYKPERTLFG